MNPDVLAILALLLTPGIGMMTARRAVLAAATAGVPLDALLHVSPRRMMQLLPPGMQDVAAHLAVCTVQHRERARTLLQQIHEIHAYALCISDPLYPRALNEALQACAPPLVFGWGDLRHFSMPAAAIVGTCEPSGQGVDLGRTCAETFARSGVAVVSGGARGIDTAAHQGALDAGGNTIVVLPQGLLTYRVPQGLYEAIQEGRALLCSEFVPDAPWETHAAVTRNAMIAALSRVTCVVEPRRMGGSVRTAQCTLAQGKHVLIHTTEEYAWIASELASPRTFRLLNEENIFDAEHLLAHWRSACGRKDPEPQLWKGLSN